MGARCGKQRGVTMAYGRWGRTPCRGGGWSRFGPPQVRTCEVGSPPGPGRGIQAFSRESPDAKSRGGIPPAPPFFRARSLALARFEGCCPGSVRGAVSSDMLRPIWDAFSSKKYAEKAFYERKSPNQGRKMGGEIAPRPGQCGTNPKTSERQQAGHKTGGPGSTAPGPLSPHFSGEMGTPAG